MAVGGAVRKCGRPPFANAINPFWRRAAQDEWRALAAAFPSGRGSTSTNSLLGCKEKEENLDVTLWNQSIQRSARHPLNALYRILHLCASATARPSGKLFPIPSAKLFPPSPSFFALSLFQPPSKSDLRHDVAYIRSPGAVHSHGRIHFPLWRSSTGPATIETHTACSGSWWSRVVIGCCLFGRDARGRWDSIQASSGA